MAASVATKTAWKLQEITAHRSNVSCLVLGKTSGRLMATGGDDCRVNIWSVNKPNCIMSLTGHTTPVESVKINTDEELIVAGSQSGSIRIWDLETAKIFRILMGHRANISSLDFHPLGSFVASGSMDTNIKLWDVRTRDCVFRYKGHTQAVRCLRFSPDGKWLASSADDYTVKLWDLTAGKMMSQFTEHTGPVNIIEFHPKKYLLASGSSDRTIRFWDLEKFQVVSCIRTPVRCMLSNPDGCCLYAGCKDSLRVYGWQPQECFDVVLVNWDKIADLSICKSQLIGASFTQSLVSTFVVELNQVIRCESGLHGLIQDDSPLAQPHSMDSFFPSIGQRSNKCSKAQREKHSLEIETTSPSSYNDLSVRSLFGNTFQGRFLVVFSSRATNPLKIWKTKEGSARLFRDKNIKSKVLELKAADDKEIYLQCPPDTRSTLGITLPVIGILVKPLGKCVTLKVMIKNVSNASRWLQFCSSYITTCLNDFFSTVYMQLDDGWNLICYNLFDHNKWSSSAPYMETSQIRVCGSCQICTIFFTDQNYSEEILHEELKLPILVKAKKRSHLR